MLIEDAGFAEAMEKMFLADLKNSHELMLRPHRAREPFEPRPRVRVRALDRSAVLRPDLIHRAVRRSP